VYFQDQVFLLCNEKDEWVLPKGVIRGGALSQDVAVERVKDEGGIPEVKVLSPAGETSYEFYSLSRKMPVCNQIMWYIMRCPTKQCLPNREMGFQDGRFFSVQDGIAQVTYTQDKALVRLAWERLCELERANT
jgi:hypothetical protein